MTNQLIARGAPQQHASPISRTPDYSGAWRRTPRMLRRLLRSRVGCLRPSPRSEITNVEEGKGGDTNEFKQPLYFPQHVEWGEAGSHCCPAVVCEE